MDVKPVFAVALVAGCMAFSFVLKTYNNQTNIVLFGSAEKKTPNNRAPAALTDYFNQVKSGKATAPALQRQPNGFASRAFMVRVTAE